MYSPSDHEICSAVLFKSWEEELLDSALHGKQWNLIHFVALFNVSQPQTGSHDVARWEMPVDL